MWLFSRSLLFSAVLAWSVTAAPTEQQKDKRSIVERDGVTYHVFEHAATGAKIEFVKNSGICETTPGVNQYSGYLSVGTNMNMWFWYVVQFSQLYHLMIWLGSLKRGMTPALLPLQPGLTVALVVPR